MFCGDRVKIFRNLIGKLGWSWRFSLLRDCLDHPKRSIKTIKVDHMLEIFVTGGPVMYLLLVCSIIVVTVIFERSFFWIELHKKRDTALLSDIEKHFYKNEWSEVIQKMDQSKDYIVRVLFAGINHREGSLLKAMETAAADEVKQMRKNMGVLDTMITVAPLLGIFGTVIGIIASFKVLGASGVGNPQAVTSGIAEALLTTAAGLAISILAVFPFNFFNSKVENAAHQIEQYATALELIHEKEQSQTGKKGK